MFSRLPRPLGRFTRIFPFLHLVSPIVSLRTGNEPSGSPFKSNFYQTEYRVKGSFSICMQMEKAPSSLCYGPFRSAVSSTRVDFHFSGNWCQFQNLAVSHIPRPGLSVQLPSDAYYPYRASAIFERSFPSFPFPLFADEIFLLELLSAFRFALSYLIWSVCFILSMFVIIPVH